MENCKLICNFITNQQYKLYMKLKNCKKAVTSLLTNYPILQDDKNSTVAYIWRKEVKAMGKDLNEITGLELLKMFCRGELSDPENIRRNWQKIQQENEHLRGSQYAARHNKVAPDVKNQIKNYDDIQ